MAVFTHKVQLFQGVSICVSNRYVHKYTAHTLTVPVVSRFGHFVICIYILAFGSNFFITSKLRLNLLVATSKLSLNLLVATSKLSLIY